MDPEGQCMGSERGWCGIMRGYRDLRLFVEAWICRSDSGFRVFRV